MLNVVLEAAAESTGLLPLLFVLLPPLILVFGGAIILAAASANTILQTIVEDRLRGRVAAFYMLAFIGIGPLGSLAAGAIAASARPGSSAIRLISPQYGQQTSALVSASAHEAWEPTAEARLGFRPLSAA